MKHIVGCVAKQWRWDRQAVTCILLVQLSNMLTQHQLFYVCIVPFIAFFGAFAFFLYPNVDALHPTRTLSCNARPFVHVF